jgi:Flp pilus assembly protein TadD
MPTGRPRSSFAALAALFALIASAATWASRDDVTTATVHAQLGDLLFNDGRFTDASTAYERAFGLAPAPLKTHVGQQWVKSLLRASEFRRAREVAAEVVEGAVRDPEVVALEGDALWAVGQFDAAEVRYRDALTLAPALARARSGMARTLLSRNRLDEGLEEALAALNSAPEEPDLYPTLVHAYQRAKRYEDAATTLAAYINLLPFKDSSDVTIWARQQVRFMRAFGDRPPLQESRKSEGQVHRIPFRVHKDKLLVKGRVNGSIDTEFVLDTGAEMTVITKPVADRLGVKPDVYTLSAGVGNIGMRGLLVGRLERLQVGSLDVRNVPTLIKNPPLMGLPTAETEGLNPLALGYSMTVDYRNRVLTLQKSVPEPLPGAQRLPIRVHRLAMVNGVINRDNPVPFVIDTGGEVISLNRSTAEALQLRPRRHIGLKVYGMSGWDPTAFLLQGLHLAFDRVQLVNQAVVVLDLEAPSALLGFELGGIVGHRFLSKYKVTVDLPRSEMWLE